MQHEKISLDDIKNALKNNAFIFYYQPKISLITGKTIGAEALLRWQMADGTIIPPLEFIPQAEASGFITEITRTMFHKLIADIAGFGDAVEECVISFNASARDFYDSRFVDDIRAAIDKNKLDPRKFEIELTESSVSTDKNISAQLASLTELGVSLAMDDFGSGYSTLGALSKLHFTAIKIDQGIISQAVTSGKSKEIVNSSLRMGYQLGLDVVAEGIENKDTYTALQHLGCTAGQGFWISLPLPRDDFVSFLHQNKQWPASSLGIIYLAQQEHVHWRKEIIEHAFFGGAKDVYGAIDGMPSLDHRTCGLGRWYYGKTGQKMSHTPTFKSLENPHIRLHELGRQLLDATENNMPLNERAYIFYDFKTHSNIVMTLLQQLENEYLMSEDNRKA